MYQPLPTPEEMALWDRQSIEEYGILPEILMENAAREALDVLEREKSLFGLDVVLFAGSGNNGGDAFALARHLHDRGAKPLVLHAKPRAAYTGSAAYHLSLARAAGVHMVPLKQYNLDFLPRHSVVVDGLLGTGFSGELRENYQEWIEAINTLGTKCFVLALDIPSGLNGLTGRPSPIAVRADCTVTFEEAKLGLILEETGRFTGRIEVRQIGIPRSLKQDLPPAHLGLTRSILDLYPRPERDMHKGTAGHLLIVGGSRGLTGAPVLAGLGALRAGSGLVSIACPGKISAEIKSAFPDIMTIPLGDGDIWDQGCFSELENHLDRFDACVLGPGLGRQDSVSGFMQAFLANVSPGLVVDADGLYWLGREQQSFEALPGKTILTPHPGEMGRLLDMPIPSVQQDRIGSARHVASQGDLVVVLKGAGTVIAHREHPVYISPISSPALAVGGSGDVLSGILGSLLARGLDPVHAACLGVYWHGLCGLNLEKTYPLRGNLAQEIAHALPHTLKEFSICSQPKTS
ncbi:MAG: NAD(P)H-hydrate dehydratase [Desulfovibrionales bacterium]